MFQCIYRSSKMLTNPRTFFCYKEKLNFAFLFMRTILVIDTVLTEYNVKRTSKVRFGESFDDK